MKPYYHFLDIDKIPTSALHSIIQNARKMKRERMGYSQGKRDESLSCKEKILAMIFEKPSTRTRVSFDIAMRQLSGEVIMLTGSQMQLGQGETIADTARCLSRYVDAVVMRTYLPETIEEFAEHASIPVINGLTNRSHPCQIMADILTYEEHRGSLSGRKVVWLGDANNVCTSFIHAAAPFEFHLTIACPPSFQPDAAIVAKATEKGAKITILQDAMVAAQGADLIVTDTWLSMHHDEKTQQDRYRELKPYQVRAELMAEAKENALFMHCLPAHRGEEVTSEILDGSHSVVFDEAANRVHAQKAILRWCFQV